MHSNPSDYGNQKPSGRSALVTTLITLLVVLVGTLMIQPKLTQRRLNIDDRDVLTADEVADLPDGTLAVVLDRRPGQDAADFRFRLLKLVMERSGQPYVLGLSAVVQPQDEAIAALAAGRDQVARNPYQLSVGVYGAGRALNQRLRPIEIPVTGGLLGLRVGWTNQAALPDLNTVHRLDDLRRFTLLQGLGWSDVDVFDAAGLRTYTARSEVFFRLVDNNRVQLFPRGLSELAAEAVLVQRTAPQTVLDPQLLMVYPFAGFFYVSPKNKALADAIRRGFQQAMRDGSYQRLLEDAIMTGWLRENLNLHARRVLVLSNPEAQDVLAGVDSRHWIIPWSDLLEGRISKGAALCEIAELRPLCRPSF